MKLTVDKEIKSSLFGIIKYGSKKDGIFVSSVELYNILKSMNIFDSIAEPERLDMYLTASGYYKKQLYFACGCTDKHCDCPPTLTNVYSISFIDTDFHSKIKEYIGYR
jgi:hypothetical protein